jgi:hypothetical protein
MYYTNGKRLEGTWAKGEISFGIYTWPNGDRYEGQLQSNDRSGQGTQIYAGEKYAGDWRSDKRIGFGVLSSEDGKTLYRGQWENDARKESAVNTVNAVKVNVSFSVSDNTREIRVSHNLSGRF